MMMDYIVGLTVGLGIGFVFFSDSSNPTPQDTLADNQVMWDLPTCPRELTLQDGSRWAPPSWGDPRCDASIIYTVEPFTLDRMTPEEVR